jgi:hypothetical protein
MAGNSERAAFMGLAKYTATVAVETKTLASDD